MGDYTDIIDTSMISIIIPLYNEKDNVLVYKKDLFPVIEKIGKEFGEIIEFIMVDDGSKDDTVVQMQKLIQERNDVILIKLEINQGMGSAIKSGIAASKGNLIITMDADLTFRPVDVSKLIAKYRETNADCVSGSPFLKEGLFENVATHRLIISKSINFLYRLLLGSNISCVSPIFRLYKREIFDTMKISSNNFDINAEIISKLIISGKKVVEVPVPLLKRRYGKSNINIRKEAINYLVLFYKIFKTKYLNKEWV
jgi:glycosyltransferase involved in cell wall biosynthesis